MKYRFKPDLCRDDALFSEKSLLAYGLTPNRIYEVTDIETKRTRHEEFKDYLTIINDYNEMSRFSSNWFKSIEEEREEKLNELGIK